MIKNNNDGIITFYYKRDELFNDVGQISAYMTKNLASESGSALDDYAITDDEKDIFNVCVKQTLPNVYEVLMKMSTGVKDAFDDDATENGVACVKLSINDNEAYNENILSLVNATIEDCLRYGILAEFYSINSNATLQQIAQGKFSSNLLLLNQRLFQLKRKKISSQL